MPLSHCVLLKGMPQVSSEEMNMAREFEIAYTTPSDRAFCNLMVSSKNPINGKERYGSLVKASTMEGTDFLDGVRVRDDIKALPGNSWFYVSSRNRPEIRLDGVDEETFLRRFQMFQAAGRPMGFGDLTFNCMTYEVPAKSKEYGSYNNDGPFVPFKGVAIRYVRLHTLAPLKI